MALQRVAGVRPLVLGSERLGAGMAASGALLVLDLEVGEDLLDVSLGELRFARPYDSAEEF